MRAKKILVLRFSSIGDIVLTTPVLRSLKQARPEWELHYWTKPDYRELLAHNPWIDRLHLLENRLGPQIRQLKKEKFDHILDLHHNLRTLRIKWGLRASVSSFDKRNLAKFRLVRTKRLSQPITHVVERYGETLTSLGLTLDGQGLEMHLPQGKDSWAKEILTEASLKPQSHILAVVLGAKFPTKRWIPSHFHIVLEQLKRPILLLGGKDARPEAEELLRILKVPVFDAVGKYDLVSSAALLKQCREVLTHDTGFMHIAAAFGIRVHSIWGSTVPEFGMTPYQTPHTIIQNEGLSCRPCSKIGFQRCPKGHFRCMKDISPEQVVSTLLSFDP